MRRKSNPRNILWGVLSISVLAVISIILIGQKTLLSFVRAASIDDTPVTRKIYVLDFNPTLNNQGGVKLIQYKNWSDPSSLTNQLISTFSTVSHGYLTYSLVGFDEVDRFYPKPSGYQFTDQSYLDCLANTSTCNSEIINYQQLFTDYDLCNKGADEIWLWGGPWFGYWEYNPVPYCPGKTTFVMGFNYERQFDEALHDFGHRMEFVANNRVGNGNWQQDETNEWNKYSLIANHCGNVHYPPGSSVPADEYIYNKSTPVTSDCDGYANYPTGPFIQTQISCTAWGCTQVGYLQWWLTHIPSQVGQTTVSGKTIYNNWWKYYANYDETYQPEPTPISGQFSNLNSTLIQNQSTFNFSYSGTSSTYRVDMSINSDMVNGTYLTFGQGSSSPIVVTNPTKWTSYTCGTPFWWRVVAADNTTSPIQSAVVDCSIPTSTPLPTPIPTSTPIPTPTTVTQFSNMSATLRATQSIFNFGYAGNTASYRIDLSISSNMVNGTYLTFGQGTGSPIVVNDPTKWTSYTCGTQFWWRVVTANNVMSPIQTATVDCTTPTSTLIPTKTPTTIPTRTPTPTPIINLLLNNGFETDSNNDSRPDLWTSDSHFTRTTTSIHGGSFSGKHTATNNANYTIQQTVSGIIPGRGYAFSGWVNVPSTTDPFTFTIQAKWKKSNGSAISTTTLKSYSTTTSGWNNAVSSMIAPATSASVDIIMNVQSLKSTLYVDDFRLY